MNELKPEDVMRALECCIEVDCGSIAICPRRENYKNEYICSANLKKDALALLREKDAEIERLKKANQNFAELENGYIVTGYKNIRAEAITEFVERLQQCTECMGECTVDNPLAETYSVVREEYIDQIAKEMKGETE